MKTMGALIVEEECDVETNEKIKNKTIAIINKIENCKPFLP